MMRLLTLTISLVLIIGAETDVEKKIWELMDAIYPKMEHLRKCEPSIEINLIFKRLIVNNNIVLCGESKFFQYKRLLRNNLNLAVKICHWLNVQIGVLEHFGTNYSKVYCVWPKIFSETSYCVANSHLNFPSEQVENLHNCSEAEILAKFGQESPKRSVNVIFKRTEKALSDNLVSDKKAMIFQLSHYEQNEENEFHAD
ncbi:hypothetical protein X798_04464 [Onchocerca flexuosa]|uniref:Uncharacterized protein n=1 Tax=Onchocerca flexuosa TaxID=387005 RepID=A0A238BV01_9BILA|nr:hypothetical protein X798_04464 [Onchocerca flexuosa]